MSTLLRRYGLRFHFYEAEPAGERPHVHIDGKGCSAKVWLDPIELQWEKGFKSGELKRALRTVADNRDAFLEAWNARER